MIAAQPQRRRQPARRRRQARPTQVPRPRRTPARRGRAGPSARGRAGRPHPRLQDRGRRQDVSHLPRRPAPPHRHLRRRRRRRLADGPAPLRPRRRRPRFHHRRRPQHGRRQRVSLVAHAEGQRPVHRPGSVHLDVRLRAQRAVPQRPPQRHLAGARPPHAAAAAAGHAASRWPRTPASCTPTCSRPTASARCTPRPPTRAPTGPSTTTRLEPVVENVPGLPHLLRGARRAAGPMDDKTDRIHGPYKPDGFVSLALDKGYRLGFQASSDHISTHVSYACVLAEEFSRKGLIDAMQEAAHLRRHGQHRAGRAHGRAGHHGRRGAHRTSRGWTWWCWARGRSTAWTCCATARWSTRETPAKDAAEARFHWDDPDAEEGREGELLLRPRAAEGRPDGVGVADLGAGGELRPAIPARRRHGKTGKSVLLDLASRGRGPSPCWPAAAWSSGSWPGRCGG